MKMERLNYSTQMYRYMYVYITKRQKKKKTEEIIWPWSYSVKECKFHSKDGNATGTRYDTRT